MQFNLPAYNIQNTAIVVAVSGGVDSVVLAVWLQQLGFDISIAHCNFQLRGAESEADEAFVCNLAANMQVPIHCKRMDTQAAMQKWRVGIQEAARRLRYDWFIELLDKAQVSIPKKLVLATAHHQNDNIETFVHHALRGTGLRGLRGMPQVNRRIIRPFLAYTKQDILAYAQQNNLLWRDDSSNAKNDYTRNKIRHTVVPAFAAVRPDYAEQLQLTMDNLAATQAVLDEFSQRIKTTAMTIYPDHNAQVRLIEITDFTTATQLFLLTDWLTDYGFTRAQIQNILDAAETNGRQFLTHNAIAILHNKVLIIQKNNNANHLSPKRFYIDNIVYNQIIKTDFGDIDIQKAEKANVFANKDKNIGFFDAQKLVLPLYIDRWISQEDSISFQPLGMGGKTKKISDFLHDLGLNYFQKSEVRLLFDANHQIVWVIGYRSDYRFRVSDDTINIVAINILEQKKP